MAAYEVVREIENLCGNNQMRDVFFEEIETESPEAYVKENGRFPVIDTIENEDGDKVIITGDGKGYIIRYTFSA